MLSRFDMTLRYPLVLALTLAACGPDPTSSGAANAGGEPALPDTAMIREVSPESTLEFVSGDLLAASPSAAIQTIDLWIARLDTVSADGVAELRDDLTTLRNLLQSSPLDGPAIGRTLRDVGEQTGVMAEAGTPLAALGQALGAQGRRLAPDSTGADSVGVRGADGEPVGE